MSRYGSPASLLVVLLFGGVGGSNARAGDLKDVAGRWILDLDYVHELWKQDRGAKYSESEWAKIRNDPGQIDTDEVHLDEKTIAFFFHGKLNVSYPILGWQAENDVVWVDFKHFLGQKMRTGFVRDGDRLKLIHSDRVWWLFQGYKKATAQD